MDQNTNNLIRLADTLSMREMDRHAIEDLGISGSVLMENAARSVADWVQYLKNQRIRIMRLLELVTIVKIVKRLK